MKESLVSRCATVLVDLRRFIRRLRILRRNLSNLDAILFAHGGSETERSSVDMGK